MKDLFAMVLSPEIAGGPDSLLDSLRPLGTSSARIQMSAALRWISPSVYRDLTLIRKIRNEFAHKPFVSSFNEPPISDWVNLITHFDLAASAPEHFQQREFNNRERFFAGSLMNTVAMITEMTWAPRAISRGLQQFRNRHYLKIPSSHGDLWEALARIMQDLHKRTIPTNYNQLPA